MKLNLSLGQLNPAHTHPSNMHFNIIRHQELFDQGTRLHDELLASAKHPKPEVVSRHVAFGRLTFSLTWAGKRPGWHTLNQTQVSFVP